MKRGYCKEGDTEPGRAKTKVPRRPADFLPCDTSGWDVRRFFRELAIRKIEHAWQSQKEEWKRDREDTSWDRLNPVSDPDESNRFLGSIIIALLRMRQEHDHYGLSMCRVRSAVLTYLGRGEEANSLTVSTGTEAS
jgi:hypothetical protein